MGFPVSPALDRPFKHRSAFLLNANARAVSDRLIEELAEIIPAGDLFLSRTLEDAEVFARTIARRGYGQVFFGGGDGTLVTTLALLRQVCAKESLAMPAVGVLKLGTGNAMARTMGASRAIIDANHVVHKGPMAHKSVELIESDGGLLSPFAGMGYDGAVLNDYVWLKKKVKSSPPARAVVESVWGYLGAMLFKTVPQELKRDMPRIKVTSKSDAFLMVQENGKDVETVIPAGTVLFEGKSPIISIGAIPFFGYGFTMFPFAQKKAGYAHLRLGSIPIPVILANLWPGIWQGSFRHPLLRDFLVKDVVIESDRDLPCQVGGDAAGHKKSLSFAVCEQPVQMVELGERLVPEGHTVVQLGPARVMLRLPR